MSADELSHLVKMANQIALNAGAGCTDEVAAGKVADHIGRYWAVPMRKRIVDHLDQVAADLSPAARGAVERIKQELGAD